MSLTIFPREFGTRVSPKASPTVAPVKEAPSDSKVGTHSANADVKVDLSHLEIIKIIPEENTYDSSNFSLDRNLVNNKNTFSINLNSNELVIKKIAPEIREDTRETPEINQQTLNHHVREYQKLAFEELQ